MDRKMRNAIIVCCAVAVTTAAVIISAFAGNNTPNRSISISDENAVSHYENAVKTLNAQSKLSMTVMQTKNTTIAGDTFSEDSVQELQYTGLGTEDMCGSAEQKINIGSHTISSVELYAKNTGYFTVQGASFQGSITADAYLDRYVPGALITPSLYKTVSARKSDSIIVISFSDATAPERWLVTDAQQFHCASGIAHLDEKGSLIYSEYDVSYSKNGMLMHLHITVKINSSSRIKISIPEEADQYTKIQYLDAPLDLEVACGYLMIADTISANYTNTITHQAYGDSRKEKIALNIHTGDNWSARLDTNIVLTNTSLGDQKSNISQSEVFADNKYIVTLDGETQELPLDEATMKTLCRNQLVGTILLPQYIQNAKVVEKENTLRIEITPTDTFIKEIRADIHEKLYQKADEISEKYKTNSVSCYLDLDLKTRMPVATGISYAGTYKKDGITYTMSSDTVQTYNLASATAYDAIHK